MFCAFVLCTAIFGVECRGEMDRRVMMIGVSKSDLATRVQKKEAAQRARHDNVMVDNSRGWGWAGFARALPGAGAV